MEAKGEVVGMLDGLPEVPGLREIGSDDEEPTFVDKGVRPRRRPEVGPGRAHGDCCDLGGLALMVLFVPEAIEF